jgi:hypothetical protein
MSLLSNAIKRSAAWEQSQRKAALKRRAAAANAARLKALAESVKPRLPYAD